MTHPFQTEPGTSQRQRVMDNLLSGPAKIDGRSLADLLAFFVQLSEHISYYDETLQVSDWKPFFSKSLPFTVAEIIRFDYTGAGNRLNKYKTSFAKKPSVAGIQLLLNYIYNRLIRIIDRWQLQLTGSGLNAELVMERLIKDKLKQPVTGFIALANASTKWFCTKNYNFTGLSKNPVWELDITDLYAQDESFRTGNSSKRKKLLSLHGKILQSATVLLDVIRLMGTSASLSLQQSLLPLQEELKEKQPPHLAVLFAFLNMFRQLQADLNGFTRKHLDYFYKQVLKLVSKQAAPDKVHIIGDIQKQLDKYLLKKGTLLKDGKDLNKADILFSVDDDLIINKTQVADQRTLFLNNIHLSEAGVKKTLMEGVYMAPDATKADGIEKDFADAALASRAALGAKWSKYTDPENKFTYPYPNARLGFILASPVLLLNEGTRKITITLSCELSPDFCRTLNPETASSNPCCDDPAPTRPPVRQKTGEYPPFEPAVDLIKKVCDTLNVSYYYINRALIATAAKKGASKTTVKKLQDLLEEPLDDTCYCTVYKKNYERVITEAQYNALLTADERESVKKIFVAEKAVNIKFSGADEWIVPAGPVTFTIPNCATSPSQFNLTITTTLTPDVAAVTFYNAEKLKEDFNTTQPLVKIELNDHIKLDVPVTVNRGNEECCEKLLQQSQQDVSLYHFFRNVIIKDFPVASGIAKTGIKTEVCGVKNLIVQNDENIEDVNSLVHAFGVRPKVDANFYIGSQEIFSKNWQQIWVNAEWKDKPANLSTHYKFYKYEAFEDGSNDITEASFKVTHAVLESGKWKVQNPPAPPAAFRQLFNAPGSTVAPFCGKPAPVNNDNKDSYYFQRNTANPANYDFIGTVYEKRDVYNKPLLPLNIASDYGFLRLTLKGVSFQHDRYAFVVARHMMALAGLIDPLALPKVKQYITESLGIITVITDRINSIDATAQSADGQASTGTSRVGNLGDSGALLTLQGRLRNIRDLISNDPATTTAVNNTRSFADTDLRTLFTAIDSEMSTIDNLINSDPVFPPVFIYDFRTLFSLRTLVDQLRIRIEFIQNSITGDPELLAGLPKEPYTPAIRDLSIDYEAKADINDISLIHLYPYAGTYKPETLPMQPTLFPTFCDEGNLFIGLSGLVPGSNVNILFQLAEATADSESEREFVTWYYLENNSWKLLRNGFEVLDDDTNGLTTSGIIKFALPANMTNENTILPKGMHWIKAGIAKNSKSVSEIMALHTQAIKATFTNTAENDKTRLAAPLPASSVSKLQVADASITKISQPYESFGGAEPEENGHYYVRVSELLRHKNRAIQKFDYERLVLEAFPNVFKVKCINHTYGLSAHDFVKDFTAAPGYVLLAVIPDLNKLKAAKTFEPKAPVSLLEEIKETLQKHTSPFVRMKVMNPRYEKINFCLRVKLLPGKDESYYKEKLKQDIYEFLAPWAVGEYDKLTFGQPVNFSDIVRFLESRDYLDYIIDLVMEHEDVPGKATPAHPEILPLTPRSILVGGYIDVCIDQGDCPEWGDCGGQDENGVRSTGIPCCDHDAQPINDYCNDRRTDIKQ